MARLSTALVATTRTLADALTEGVFDPAIFKAFFLAGGPGSGKSFVNRQVTAGQGLMTVNSDFAFEAALKKAGLSMKLDPEEVGTWGPVRDRAKDLTKKRQALWVNERLGLVIDGTSSDASDVSEKKAALERVGYDTFMIFVNTSLETALARNRARSRTVPENIVREIWSEVQANLPVYRGMFGGRFVLVQNDTLTQDDLDVAEKAVRRFVNTPPQNPVARAWIAARGGTGAIANWS